MPALNLLTQKRLAGEAHVARYKNRDEWADVVRSLIDYGAKHGHVLDEVDAELVASVLPEGKVNTNEQEG